MLGESVLTMNGAGPCRPGKEPVQSAKGIDLIGPWPSTNACRSETIWADKTTLVLVLRRLGCPLVRDFARGVVAQIPHYRLQGINVVAVSGDVVTAAAFVNDVWNIDGDALPLFHDPSLGFYRAIGARKAKQWKVFAPKVLYNIFTLENPTASCDDLFCRNTAFLGGALVLAPDRPAPGKGRLGKRSNSDGDEAQLPAVDTRLYVGHEDDFFEHIKPGNLFKNIVKAQNAVNVRRTSGLNSVLGALNDNVIQSAAVDRDDDGKPKLQKSLSAGRVTPPSLGEHTASKSTALTSLPSSDPATKPIKSPSGERVIYGLPVFDLSSYTFNNSTKEREPDLLGLNFHPNPFTQL